MPVQWREGVIKVANLRKSTVRSGKEVAMATEPQLTSEALS